MSARQLAATFATVCSALVACSSPNDEPDLGVATAAITNVPSDVACVVVTVTGNRVAERRLDVVPGASSILTMNGLPVGGVVFRANAYPTACSTVTASSSPTWLSNGVNVTLSAGVDVPVTLPLRRNGSSTVSLDFDDGPSDGGVAPDASDAGSATLAPSPSNLTFGGVALGSTMVATVNVTNTGSVPSVPAAVAITGANAAQFTIVSNGCGVPIAPAASCSIGVRFAPTLRGAASANLGISAAPAMTNVTLSGLGLAAQLTISPTSRNYGSQSMVSPSAPFGFVVTNVGDLATGIPSPALLGGPNASDFQVANNGCTSPIAPGASCVMQIVFAPQSTGTKNATLSQNPAGTPGVSAALTGTGSIF